MAKRRSDRKSIGQNMSQGQRRRDSLKVRVLVQVPRLRFGKREVNCDRNRTIRLRGIDGGLRSRKVRKGIWIQITKSNDCLVPTFDERIVSIPYLRQYLPVLTAICNEDVGLSGRILGALRSKRDKSPAKLLY